MLWGSASPIRWSSRQSSWAYEGSTMKGFLGWGVPRSPPWRSSFPFCGDDVYAHVHAHVCVTEERWLVADVQQRNWKCKWVDHTNNEKQLEHPLFEWSTSITTFFSSCEQGSFIGFQLDLADDQGVITYGSHKVSGKPHVLPAHIQQHHH